MTTGEVLEKRRTTRERGRTGSSLTVEMGAARFEHRRVRHRGLGSSGEAIER